MVLESKINLFLGKLRLGVDFFLDAGRMLVEMIDEDPQICLQIVADGQIDWLTMDVLSTFEAIGRKQLAVEAMFLPKHVLARLIALPTEQQATIATRPVRVLNGAKNRSVEVSASRLTKRQAALAIGPNGVRSIEEQRGVRNTETISATPEKFVGYFELTVMNGKVFAKRVEKSARAQKVRLDARGQAVLEVVS